jgi:hypothetical protein
VPPTPPPTPTPAPSAVPFEHYIVGDYVFAPEVYNEFEPNVTGPTAFRAGSAVFEFPIGRMPWMIEGDYRAWQVTHFTTALSGVQPANPCPVAGEQGCVTLPAGLGQYFFPNFTNQEYDIDARLAARIWDPHIYVGVGYIWNMNNTLNQFTKANPTAPICNPVPAVAKGYTGLPWCGYPARSGVEFGIEKLPELNQVFSIFASAWYAPNVGSTSYGVPTAAGITYVPLSYRQLKYQIGIAINVNKLVFLDIGYLGDVGWAKANAPVNYTHNGLELGFGLHF